MSSFDDAHKKVEDLVEDDPFADALAAIARSQAARGATAPEPIHPIRSPHSDPVESALAAAAAARQLASSGGRKNAAREQAAREQLAALKAGRPMSSPSEAIQTVDTPLGVPKKRTL